MRMRYLSWNLCCDDLVELFSLGNNFTHSNDLILDYVMML